MASLDSAAYHTPRLLRLRASLRAISYLQLWNVKKYGVVSDRCLHVAAAADHFNYCCCYYYFCCFYTSTSASVTQPQDVGGENSDE